MEVKNKQLTFNGELMKINISILSIIILISSFLLAYQLSFAEELTIYDIQYTTEPSGDSPYKDQTVTVTGIVSATGYYSSGNSKRFFITDTEGGPWHGIFIFNYDYNVELGDKVRVTGKVSEYYNLTELTNISTITILSSGNSVPEPIEINTGDLINSSTAEQYEGCLVKISNVEITQLPNNYNEWYVNDGSGECQIDDGIYEYQPTLGENIAHIIGVVDYSYSEYGINPRMAEDILQIADIDIVISNIQLTPDIPFFDEDITISAEITTYGCSLVADTLFYKLASETIYQDTIMVDTLGTNEYSAVIPAFNIMENIVFYIKAVSDSGIVRETSLQTITIRDRSPIITEIDTRISNDSITVSAKIEDTDGQVVKAYTLCWLDFSEDYFTYPMVRDTTDTTCYNGIIPPQSQGSTIYFKICAVDDSGLIAYADDNGKPYEYRYQ